MPRSSKNPRSTTQIDRTGVVSIPPPETWKAKVAKDLPVGFQPELKYRPLHSHWIFPRRRGFPDRETLSISRVAKSQHKDLYICELNREHQILTAD